MTGAKNQKSLWEERVAMARLEQQRGKPEYRSAPPMQHALRRALAPLLKEAGPATNSLAARWIEIAGPRLGAMTEPLRVQTGKGGSTLHIRAPSAAAPMLQHAAAHIMEKVSLATGAKIKAIKIVQTAAPAKPVARSANVRQITAEERSALSASLQPVQTPAIRQALEKLGEAVLTWRA